MSPTVRDFVTILETFFNPEIHIRHALSALQSIVSLSPLLQLHRRQREMPFQRAETGWLIGAKKALQGFFRPHPPQDYDVNSLANCIDQISEHLENISEVLDAATTFIPSTAVPILVTARRSCVFCNDVNGRPQALQKKIRARPVSYINQHHVSSPTIVVVAHCPKCRADYHPDRFTFRVGRNTRRCRLEYNTEFIRVSKTGVWVHRKVAIAQEKAVLKMKVGWSNYAEFLRETHGSKFLSNRQSKRMYLEHVGRRLLLAHGIENEFECDSNPSPQVFCEALVESLGQNGGIVPGALEHGCTDCAHEKRYLQDLMDDGINLGAAARVANAEDHVNDELQDYEPPQAAGVDEDRDVPQTAQQLQPPGGERGYVRCSVMDGKTISHRICAMPECRGALENYRNGRFCRQHANQVNKCGIANCVNNCVPGSLVCHVESHQRFHNSWVNRFKRLSYPGVRRVLRLQQIQEPGSGPVLEHTLPELDGLPGEDVKHTFRARTTYCLQTIQWSCGVPIGWGKCYEAESPTQVLQIIESIWADNPEHKPSFLFYDNACKFLRHIIAGDPDSHWIDTTRFIVDVWHYINHRATDILCRTWCNPAPTDGSQPDLILAETDDNGVSHFTPAFNTETAEQFNSWLNGFESALRQMTATNFDFFVHSLMLLYKEDREAKIKRRGLYIGPF